MTEQPSPVHPKIAKAAVDKFLADPDWQRHAAESGWEIRRHDSLTLIVSLGARPIGEAGEGERYLLRLTCDYCPTHPPDVRFVHPQTLEYDPGSDQQHLPLLSAPDCHVHLNYGYPHGYPYGSQLVCSSLTLGYYFSGHSPTPDQAWDPKRHSIGSSINIVHRALNSEHYKGRQP